MKTDRKKYTIKANAVIIVLRLYIRHRIQLKSLIQANYVNKKEGFTLYDQRPPENYEAIEAIQIHAIEMHLMVCLYELRIHLMKKDGLERAGASDYSGSV